MHYFSMKPHREISKFTFAKILFLYVLLKKNVLGHFFIIQLERRVSQ